MLIVLRSKTKTYKGTNFPSISEIFLHENTPFEKDFTQKTILQTQIETLRCQIFRYSALCALHIAYRQYLHVEKI